MQTNWDPGYGYQESRNIRSQDCHCTELRKQDLVHGYREADLEKAEGRLFVPSAEFRRVAEEGNRKENP